MPIPDYQSIMLPLLQFAADGAEHRSRDGIAALAQHFNLTPEEIATLLPSGQDYLFGNRWGWARTYLKKAGLLQYPSRGKFQITDQGRVLLKEQPEKINVAVLKRYPDFLEFWNGPVKDSAGQATVVPAESPVVEQTPEELIASAHDKLRKQIHLEKSGFVFWSPEDIRIRVKALAHRAYENDLVIIAAKILFPELTR